MTDIDKRLDDLLMFSEMCAPKYNSSELSDRVLVFDIMADGWETAKVLKVMSTIEPEDETFSITVSVGKSGKRGLEDTEETEESKQKRTKTSTEQQGRDMVVETIPQESESVSMNQDESGNFQDLSSEQVENEIHELASEQAVNKEGGVAVAFPQEEPTSSTTSSTQQCNGSSGEIQEQEPLRQHRIYVHSLWLSVQSTYFYSLFHSSGMKETHDTEVHIKIPESEEDTHLILLEAMYNGGILKWKTVDEVLSVLELADKYDVKFIFKICKYVLQRRATTFEISTKIMHMIKVKHNMNDVEDLAETLQLVLAEEFSPLDTNWESEKFTSLSEPCLRYLLNSDKLVVLSENTVFHSLMYWMEQNNVDPNSLEETNDLLEVVRLKLVTIDYLYNVIRNHPIACKMLKFNQLFLDGVIYHAMPEEQKQMLRKQPVLRKQPAGKVILYTLNKQDPGHSQLRMFWACGYKMSISILPSNSHFNGYEPQLTVHNLNKESLVHLKFSVDTTESSNPNWQQETFKSTSRTKNYSSQYLSRSNVHFYVSVVLL